LKPPKPKSLKTQHYEYLVKAAYMFMELEGEELQDFNRWREIHRTGWDLDWPGVERKLGRIPGSVTALVEPIRRRA
jgi:hypothetical protein